MSTFAHYRIFVAVVEYKSFTQAAKHLHMSTSAVSKQVSKLEESLNVQLLNRSTRRVQITGSGHQFYMRCKTILQQVEEAERELLDAKEQLSGKIVITFPDVILGSGFMSILKHFGRAYPNIKIDFRMTNAVEDLLEHSIDFAFRLGNLPDSNLRAIPLCNTQFRIYASAEYVEAFDLSIEDPKSVYDCDILIPTFLNLATIRKFLFKKNSKFTPDMSRYHTFNDINALIQAMNEGLGIGILPSISVQKQVDDGSLVNLLPDYQSRGKRLFLVFAGNRDVSKKIQIFKAFMKQEFNSL